MELSLARRIAEEKVIKVLGPMCERIEVAGSVRRGLERVGDIEVVAIPRSSVINDLFGNMVTVRSVFEDRRDLFEEMGEVRKFGRRQVTLELVPEGVMLDAFFVLPPASWGVIYTLRTGPKDFAKWLVTNRSKGGALENGWRSEGGRITDGQVELRFDEELEFLNWMELGWIEPGMREARWGRWGRSYRSEKGMSESL